MNQQDSKPASGEDNLSFATGGGEMGERTRAFDWSRTPVGPIAQWPQSLKIAVRIMLDSRYAMWLGWGPEFTFFYNDAYAKMTLGPKHPWALGRSAREVWAEIWTDIGPRAEKVIATGEATWDEGLLLFLERQGFPEETYHTFSYSPLPGDQGGVGGMLCVVTEDTDRTIGERRLRTLRELAARTTEEAKSAEDACQTAARSLAENPKDVPFTLIYLIEDAGRTKLFGAAGLKEGSPAAPLVSNLTESNDANGWPLHSVYESGQLAVVTDLEKRFGSLSCGPWPESPQAAVVIPMGRPGQSHPAGFVVAGVSSRLSFTDEYKGFLELLTSHVTTAVTNARAYEEERKRAEGLAELDRAKTAFFSNVSHEFRTPLTLMLGPVEELLARSHTDLPPAAAGQLEIVNRNGLRLLRLVNSLLDFSRIEAGRVRAVFQPTDLASFTADLASNFRAACERAGLHLKVDCPPLHEPVFVDRDMWEKIVLNLISNAFKFTFEGEIVVSLRQVENAVELRIKDSGTGIPAEEMPRLFERFHRIENARGRTHEGSGIGLALVQELVKLHAGSVVGESAIGEGTTFTVELPLGTAHLPIEQISDARNTFSGAGATPFVEEALRWLPNDGAMEGENRFELPAYQEAVPTRHRHKEESLEDKRPRVLIADDNADMRQYIERLLADHFQVEAFPDGEAALAAVRNNPPDLILTDVMMPKLNGFGLLKELRSDARTSGLPVIMLSARAGEESRVEGMDAGADDYLVKPFGAKELLARVAAHLQMARMRQEATQTIRESEERFRGLVNATSEVVYRMSPDWTEMRYLHGREFIADTSEVSTSWLEKYIFQEDQQHITQVIQDAIAAKSVFELEHRIRRADGTPGWTFSRAVPLFNSDGQIVEWFGAASDVSARKVAEEKLRESEEQLRVTLASIGDAVITTDTASHVTYLNGVAQSLTGWTSSEAFGQPLDSVFNIINETTRNPVENPAERALREGIIVGLANHTILIRKNGTERPIDDSAAPVRDAEGHVIGCVLVFRDVSERREREKQAVKEAEASRKLAAIVDSSEDAVISKSLEGIIQSWNAAAERIFGYSSKEAVGRSITMLFPADRIIEEDRIISRIRSGERLQHFDTIRLRKDGTPIPVSLTISPIKDEDGTIVGASKIARDITERKHLEDELRKVAAELSDANRQKDEFLATLAHELRNPLAPIRNGLQLIRLARVNDATVENARTVMDRQLNHLVRLVDDLMDLSRITRGKIELRREIAELSSVVQAAVETSRPMIEEMNHELIITMPAESVLVDADPTRLAQVFMNLLTNAAKYSDRGSNITLSVVRERDAAVVSVKDTGIGIPSSMLVRVFDMFSQVDGSLDRAQGGLGIGLTLVKRIVEMHKGSVEAKSEGEGRGAEFIVRLPVVTENSKPEAGKESLTHSKMAYRFLIIDDNRDGADSLSMMLSIMGNEVATAYDGLEGLSKAEKIKPDVVLLDIGLPKLNGYEVARRIREQSWGKKTILIAVTGWGQEEDRRRSREAGFNYHMVKPVDPSELIKLLVKLSTA